MTIIHLSVLWHDDLLISFISQIICNKVREGDQRFVRIKEGDPRGRHVVIVDDLVQSGGTLIECQVEDSIGKVVSILSISHFLAYQHCSSFWLHDLSEKLTYILSGTFCNHI